jgi:hypothetical protein
MRAIPRSIFRQAEAAQNNLVRATFNEKAAAMNVQKAQAPAATKIFVVR